MAVVQYIGDWGKLRKLWSKLESGIFLDSVDYSELGNAVTERIKQHITSQDLGWKPLSSITVRKKGTDTIYIETGEYLRSIQVKVTKSGVFTRTVVIAPEGTHSSSGMSMESIATILEYGTSTIPARPLWRPTAKEVKTLPEFKEIMKNLKLT